MTPDKVERYSTIRPWPRGSFSSSCFDVYGSALTSAHSSFTSVIADVRSTLQAPEEVVILSGIRRS
jgi:hypothetical protein